MTRASRRRFLTHASLMCAGAAGLSAFGAGAPTSPGTGPRPGRAPIAPDATTALKVLFLGGTGFIGPHIVNRFIERGHTVTLFNRGSRTDELFPNLELIKGDRIPGEGAGLQPLLDAVGAGRTWDVVIDTANVHTWTDHSARVLRRAATHYVYTSSLSVYTDNSIIDQDEDGPLDTMPDDVADGIDRLPYDMRHFGAVKARSEAAAAKHFPGRATIVRPGLIVGPRDFSNRFTYWPWRVRQGGVVLAPSDPNDPVMVIDVRDLANFMVHLAETRTMGVFNANGPTTRDLTIGRLLDACAKTTRSDATFTWVDGDFLAARGVNAWSQMPVWIPPREGMEGFHRKSLARAIAAGLTTRPLASTITDTLAWLDDEYVPTLAAGGRTFEPGVNAPGITRARESELLAEWAARP
ncbi:MAG: NAD-dependent epimerase/dehydratase family protein, partial [Phycisphaerales bacterium]|nr:NAD-dependent epimerase/dehydratase family protein [Phycisphaerales bacterium]